MVLLQQMLSHPKTSIKIILITHEAALLSYPLRLFVMFDIVYTLQIVQ